jgi:hypothetical protein
MLSTGQKAAYEKEYQVMRFLYLALMISGVVILGMNLLLSQAAFPQWEPGAYEKMVQLFFGGGACLIVVIFILRRRLLPAPSAFSKAGADISKLLLKSRIGYLVVWLLSELVGILGMALLMLSGSLSYALQFSLISLLLLLIFYPRRVFKKQP